MERFVRAMYVNVNTILSGLICSKVLLSYIIIGSLSGN